MKLLLVIIILAIFQTGCKQCGRFVTFGECDPEITGDTSTTDTTPETPPTPPSPGYTLSSSSVNVPENAGSGTYTIVLNTEPTATVAFAITSSNTSQITVAPASVSFGSGNYSTCLLYTSPSPRDRQKYRMPSSA